MHKKERRNKKIRKLRSEGKTLQEIGGAYNLTRERIRQITKDIPKPEIPKKERKTYICSNCGNKFKRLECKISNKTDYNFCDKDCLTNFLENNNAFRNKGGTKVGKFNEKGELLETYKSMREAERKNDKVYVSNIIKCLNGDISQAGGYVWKKIKNNK